MKSSNRIPRHDWKNHTKFVTLNATFRILKVNATGNGHRGCIYFENLLWASPRCLFFIHILDKFGK